MAEGATVGGGRGREEWIRQLVRFASFSSIPSDIDKSSCFQDLINRACLSHTTMYEPRRIRHSNISLLVPMVAGKNDLECDLEDCRRRHGHMKISTTCKYNDLSMTLCG